MNPAAHGISVLTAAMRCEPDDFFVDEKLGFEPDGDGEHRLLRIRKKGCNTHWVASQLAKIVRVPVRDIGFAGRKDRHAVTEQWFSIRIPGSSVFKWPDTQQHGFEIVAEHRHRRKLRRGALSGNRFIVTLRDVTGQRAAIEQRLERLVSTGMPNYFGVQRFGRDGRNVDKARAMFAGQRCKKGERDMLLSAARAALFNRLLGRRVVREDWNVLIAGDIAGLDGSNSIFPVAELTPDLQTRLDAGDIHPTGPLWGAGPLQSGGGVAALEKKTCSGQLAAGLEAAGMRQDRRKLRVCIADLDWSWQDKKNGSALTLRFFLPAGSYATVLLNELGNVVDCSSVAKG